MAETRSNTQLTVAVIALALTAAGVTMQFSEWEMWGVRLILAGTLIRLASIESQIWRPRRGNT